MKVLATQKWGMASRRITLPPNIPYNGIVKRPANPMEAIDYPDAVAKYLIDLGYAIPADVEILQETGEETPVEKPESKRKRPAKVTEEETE